MLLCYIPDSLNGVITVNDRKFVDVPNAVLPGTKVQLECNSGFGAAVTEAVCLDDGTWSDIIGKCKQYLSRKVILINSIFRSSKTIY